MKSELDYLVEISERTARMEEKLDNVVEQVDDHEARMRSVEKLRWGIPGAGVLAAFVALFTNGGHSHL